MLDGSGDYVVTPITPGVGPLSVAVWVKRYATGGVNNDRIFDCFDGAPTNGFALRQPNGGKGFNFDVYNNGALQATPATGDLELNRWYHIVCTFATNSVKIYVNGVQVGATDTSCTLTQTTSVLRIGTRLGEAASYFFGMLKDFLYYDRVLTLTEIENLYYSRTIPTTPVIYYKFNNDALDSSGNGNNGTLTGATYGVFNSPRLSV
ncbi:MAG: LamG domain-containing protein [Sphingomonas sp.]